MSNSPLGDNTFVEPHSIEMSPPVPLKEVSSQNASKPIPIPNHDVVLRSNRDTIMAAESNRDTIVVADTPATGVRTIHSDDFSILQLPPTAPPQPSPPAPSSVEHHEPPPPPPVQSTSRPPTRHVESDPETSVFERRRSRAGSVSEMRRRLRKSSNVTSTIRSKVISNPMPVVPPTATRKPSFASDSSASVSHGTEVRGSHVPPVAATALARLNQRAAVTSDSETNPRLAVPKPKKSLSHVNLGLKPLPNMSLAPTVATSANTSMASAFGNLSLPRTREDLEMPASLQNAPVTSHVDHHVLPKRAQTDVARFASETLGMGSHIPQIIIEPEYYDSDPEDLATYSILTDFTMALSPIFPIAASTPGGLDRTDSLYPHQEPSPVQEDQQVLTAFAHRGYTRQTPPSPPPSPPPPRVESPLPRVVSPVPNAAPARVEQPKVAAPLYYRNPAPLPLTPPPRAKSPIAAQFHPQQLHAQLDVQQPATQAPTRARSPPPAPSRSKTVPEVRQVHREDPPARAKTVPEVRQMMHQREEDERSSQRSRDREDNGYLPVAQLRPTMSRQQTMQSQASMRRSTNVRGGSQQLFGGGAAKTQGQAQEAPAEVRGEVVQTRPARTQSPVPIRVRSPEPTLRVPAKTQVPMKDLDSPLPPPPMEVLSPAALIRDRSPPVQTMMRSPGVQTRSATMPDISSPVPTQSSPSQHLQQSPAGMPPRRYRTAPSTPALGLETPSFGPMHSHGHEMHGRSCTPTQSAGSRPLDAYPPLDFDEDLIPSKEQLARAASLVVIAQNGVRVAFGDIFREKKVVVCFIRHFWCPLCQDYMYSISRNVNPDALRRAGVDLVVIGNGSPAMIKSYKNIFHTPFSLYTDPTLCVYNALGMTLRTNDAGPDSERGQYVRHGLIGGIAMVVRNALRVGMPVWERGGDIPQLGGEFVFGPG
ncbi:hypothetical protein EW026_g4538 [Hermanssonia centrifuga]|uniref:Thioredoxin-like protein n=1 Tax=Hermanssonia centrifuga TaxID=98765 RepID=A0A4S4KGU9_9APHY|nr:hypothetical protein EW026_g4538 [Hermanssonia centrifuga]